MTGYIRSIKKKARNWYDETSEKLYLDLLVGAYENFAMRMPDDSLIHPIDGVEIEGEALKIEFLIGTSQRGLLLYRDGEVFQLFPFPGFYGITARDDLWYAFHKTGRHGRVISFRLGDNKITDAQTRIWGLSRGVHQIDFIERRLYVTNTYHNAILRYDNVEALHNVSWRNYSAIFFPNGRLRRGRASSNYNHFNSIYKYRDTVYLVAHNETYKTGRRSEIFLLDESFSVKGVSAVNGSNCHNFYKDKYLEMVGLSLEGSVQNNGEEVLHVNKFLRGMSVSDDYYIFGGSDIEPDQEKRGQAQGVVYVTDKNFNTVLTVTLGNTQVQEIRRVDKPDYALSDVPKQ